MPFHYFYNAAIHCIYLRLPEITTTLNNSAIYGTLSEVEKMTIHRGGSGNFLENPQRTEEVESKGGSGRHFAPASFISFYRDCQLPFPVLKI